MVFYFTSNTVDPPAFMYMGKDKFENEELIKHGWDRDVWFHADKLSSAHIYLRMSPNQDWENLPAELVQDCAQLTKANSIEGNKKDNITIIYTPHSNLKKSGDMAVGQVSFHNPRKVKRVLVETRLNPVVNRLNKTKVEKHPDLAAEKEAMEKEKRDNARANLLARRKEEARVAKEHAEKRWQKDHAYDDVFTEEALEGSLNSNVREDEYDDFM